MGMQPHLTLALGLLAAGCAGPPPVAAPDLEAIEAYYAENPLPPGWLLLEITSHNDNAIVTVAVSRAVENAAFSGPKLSYLTYFAAVCPPLERPLWRGIDERRDIVIERQEAASQNGLYSCRKHGPRNGSAQS